MELPEGFSWDVSAVDGEMGGTYIRGDDAWIVIVMQEIGENRVRARFGTRYTGAGNTKVWHVFNNIEEAAANMLALWRLGLAEEIIKE